MDLWTVIGYIVGILFNIGVIYSIRVKAFEKGVEFLQSGRFAWIAVFLLSAAEMYVAGGCQALLNADAFMTLLRDAAVFATATTGVYATGKTILVNPLNKTINLTLVGVFLLILLIPVSASGAQMGMTTVSLVPEQQAITTMSLVPEQQAIATMTLIPQQVAIGQIDSGDGGLIADLKGFVDRFDGRIIYLQSFSTQESCAAGDLSYRLWQLTDNIVLNGDFIARFNNGVKCGIGGSIDLKNDSTALKFGAAYVPEYKWSWFIQLVKL